MNLYLLLFIAGCTCLYLLLTLKQWQVFYGERFKLKSTHGMDERHSIYHIHKLQYSILAWILLECLFPSLCLFYGIPVFKQVGITLTKYPLLIDAITLSCLVVTRQFIKELVNAYRLFVIEKTFNCLTMTRYALEFSMAMVMSLWVSLIVFWIVLWLIQHTGNDGWLIVWLIGIMVLPLWQKVRGWIKTSLQQIQPLPDKEITTFISSQLALHNIKLKGIYLQLTSNRSQHANAYFMGIGSQQRIMVFDTLVKLLTPAELIAVILHEAGHVKYRHTVKNYILLASFSFLVIGLMQFLLADKVPFVYMIAYAILLYPLITFLLLPCKNTIYRRFEYTADRFAANEFNKEALISALEKLFQHNATPLTSHPWYRIWFFSHPPLAKRIQAILYPVKC